MKTQTKIPIVIQFITLVICLLGAGVRSADAASQTWSNAPVDALWVNTNNWVGKAAPGGINLTGTTLNNDIATFNTPLPGGIGGAGNPIIIDDATILTPVVGGYRSRQIGGITFDTTSCGAYVLYSPSPLQITDTNNPFTGALFVTHNNTIVMNAPVTTSQTILVPMFVRLPNSTPGIYNLVNNSTNPTANLIISSITHNGATTRATTFILGGTNTGNNIVTNLSEGAGNATGGFTKQGPGTWIIAGTSTFPAASPLNINDGTLVVQVPDAFGIATTATVSNTGVLRIDGVTLAQASLNLRKGGTIRANGTESLNGVVVGTQTGTTVTLSTTSASDVFTVGTALTAAAVVSGGAADSVLVTAGPGTQIFGQVNTYAGKWSFNAKTNQISNSQALGTGANANVGAGAILDLTPMGPTTFSPTTTGFGGSGTGTTVGSTAAAVVADPATTIDLTGKSVNLTFTPTAFGGDTTHPALYIAQGTLSLSGNTFFVNNASGTALGVGTYRLIEQATGNITDGGGYAVIVSGSGLAGGTVASVSVSGGVANLVVALYVPKNLVWTGGNPDSTWNTGGSANFLNGVAHTVFTASDNVTFNSIGSTNPTVFLSGTLSPATVSVDTSANDYTFTGTGQIAGNASLTKVGSGALVLQTVNSYGGGTVVSNGTLRVGAANAIASSGNGDVSVYGTGVIDLNSFGNTVNGLIGNGTVDNLAGSASVLTVGNNDKSGTFSGVLKNTLGTLALTKIGLGTEILTSSNSYQGPTTLNLGTLATVNDYALGSNDVVINAGILDVRTPHLYVSSLAGAGGAIENDTTTTTNMVVVQGASTTIFTGAILDGAGGGGMALTVLGGSLTMAGNNSYTGGTIVGSGATFAIPNSPAVVTGGLVASNLATLFLSGGSGTPGTPNSVTTVANGTVSFTSGAEGKIWQCQFFGAPGTTNRILNTMSFGQTNSFQNFLGVVRLEVNGNVRFFNGGSTSGGDNTTFEFVGSSLVHTRDAQTVNLGLIRGGSGSAGIDQATTAGNIDTYVIGAKGVDSTFEGFFRGTNNLVKVGSGKLVFDGAAATTNTDNATYTNLLFADSLVTHFGTTTISNGMLALVAPNTLTNSTSITLAAPTAVLDGTQMGYVSNIVDDLLTPTNSFLVTNGIFNLIANQTLGGIGTAAAVTVHAASGSIIAPGLASNVFGNLAINGVFVSDGAVNLRVAHITGAQSDKLTSTNMTLNGTITVTQSDTNDLLTGDVFTLFSGPVNGPATNAVTLPAQNASATVTYVWTNKLSINGTIQLLVGGTAPVNPNPTNITFQASGGQMILSWPADHTGWRLQSETNTVAQGLRTNWVEVAGSAATNQVYMPIATTNGAVFFRLIYP